MTNRTVGDRSPSLLGMHADTAPTASPAARPLPEQQNTGYSVDGGLPSMRAGRRHLYVVAVPDSHRPRTRPAGRAPV